MTRHTVQHVDQSHVGQFRGFGGYSKLLRPPAMS